MSPKSSEPSRSIGHMSTSNLENRDCEARKTLDSGFRAPIEHPRDIGAVCWSDGDFRRDPDARAQSCP